MSGDQGCADELASFASPTGWVPILNSAAAKYPWVSHGWHALTIERQVVSDNVDWEGVQEGDDSLSCSMR